MMVVAAAALPLRGIAIAARLATMYVTRGLARLWLVIASLWLPACGGCSDVGSVGGLPDARPSPDAMIDGMRPGDTSVTLTVLKDGAPAAGVAVYFLDTNDSVVLSDVTNQSGVVRADMEGGGSVTAVNPFTPPPAPRPAIDELRTFVGVKPGDHLALTQTMRVASTFTLQVPSVGGETPDTSYGVVTNCGTGSLAPSGDGSAPSAQIALADCADGVADLVVVATVPPPPGVIVPGGSSVREMFQPGAALPAPQSSDVMDMSGATWNEPTRVPFTYLNAPAAPMAALYWIRNRGNLGPFHVGLLGNAGATFVPPGVVSTGLTHVVVDTHVEPTGGAVGAHDVIDWGLAGPSYRLDLDGVLLPDLLSRPSFDAVSNSVIWSEDTAGATADLTSAAIQVNRGGRRWHWEIVAPYQPGQIVFPHLPVGTGDYDPTADDVVTAEPVMNAKVTGGYDAARPQFLNLRDRALINPDPTQGKPPDPTGFANGNSGTLVLVQTAPPGS